MAIIGPLLPGVQLFKLLNTQKKYGIRSLRMVCNSLPGMEAFYEKVMELPVKRIDQKSILVHAGTTEMIFYEDQSYKNPIYHFAFNIPENKIEESLQWLKKKNIAISPNGQGGEIFDFRNWNAHSVYWRDPAGNILEFIARHNLSNSSSRKFSSADFLYASEIGLVVDDVPSMRVEIKNQLDLNPFHGYAENFTAIGNEYNLIILVSKNRPWMGSTANIPAGIFPVQSTFINGSRTTRMTFGEYPFVINTEGKS